MGFAENLRFFHRAAAGLADKFDGRQGADSIIVLPLLRVTAVDEGRSHLLDRFPG